MAILVMALLGQKRVLASEYDSMADFLKQTTFHGNLRTYFYERAYTNDSMINQSHFLLGGYGGLVTAPLQGFQAGLTLGTDDSLWLSPKNENTTQAADTVFALTEAYLQYSQKFFTLRGADQIIDTPWIMPSDSRMKPSAYRGIYSEVRPFANIERLKNISFVGLKVLEFNGRSEAGFNESNLYIPGHAGGSGISELAGQTAPGANAFAIKYGKKGSPLNMQLWWNQFINFSQLLWLDTTCIYKTKAGFDPLAGFQFASQTGDGNNTIALAGQGQAGRSQAFGVIAGVDSEYGRLTAAYNGITYREGAFANGDLLSPYSAGYGTDPLYTTQMIGGLIEKQSAGSAIKLAATTYFFDKQLTAVLSHARYYIRPTSSYTNEPAETDFDVTYSFAKDSMVSGLSFRNRFGLMTGNYSDGHYYYERIQLQYQF